MPKLAFYVYLSIYFSLNFINLEAFDYYKDAQKQFLINTYLDDSYTKIKVMKQFHRALDDQFDQELQEDEVERHDYMIDVITILAGTYKKIVAATVIHYLLVHVPEQKNLHEIVAQIIADDTIKIIDILFKEFLYVITHYKMTWREKMWYCTCFVSLIIMIKLEIDQIPEIAEEKLSKDTPDG